MREYYRLVKPGIVRSNALTALAGFLLASGKHVDVSQLISMVAGITLVVAGGCVYNNVIDRNIDKKMKRTKNRALVTGRISVASALIYATILSGAGLIILLLLNNGLSCAIAFLGLFAYVVVYALAKRGTVHGTVIGSISGAIPPVVGYVAVSNKLDINAWLLFLILVLWQMPHFYSIAIFRSKEYQQAGIPVLPLKVGLIKTIHQINLYIVGFIIAAASLSFFGAAGKVYLIGMTAIGIWWLSVGVSGYKADDKNKWARKEFGLSLIVLLTFVILISLNALLP